VGVTKGFCLFFDDVAKVAGVALQEIGVHFCFSWEKLRNKVLSYVGLSNFSKVS